MMKNVGGIDRVARIAAGLVLIALAATEQVGVWGWIVGAIVLATGLFSFLLAYNDFLLSSALTNAEKMTMPAAIANSITAESEALLMQGVAGAVSITIPLIILIVVFQKQIVGGLTQGAVKG